MTWIEVMQSGYFDAQIYPHELEVLRDIDIPPNTIILER